MHLKAVRGETASLARPTGAGHDRSPDPAGANGTAARETPPAALQLSGGPTAAACLACPASVVAIIVVARWCPKRSGPIYTPLASLVKAMSLQKPNLRPLNRFELHPPALEHLGRADLAVGFFYSRSKSERIGNRSELFAKACFWGRVIPRTLQVLLSENLTGRTQNCLHYWSSCR